jgi:site-specific DNA-methyltransferase (adenine-specific)
MLGSFHNPDILTCLANLSSDEVFTPPNVANQMLDTLPKELWSDKTVTFLDPVSKSGVYLREITKRLLKGLEDEIPSIEDRLEHILKNQVYGAGITELTSEISRRTLYCAKKANSKYSIVNFNDEEGNLRYFESQHFYADGIKCRYCGVNKKLYERNAGLETYAYSFIHEDNIEELFNMKFDVIIGNPPYQLMDGSGGAKDSAVPIYNKFVEKAIKLNPSYLLMIIPAKWMVGGRGLSGFRNTMFSSKQIKYFFDFEDAKEVFPGVYLDGGVCYFLWERNYSGDPEYHFQSAKGVVTTKKREINVSDHGFAIRDNRVINIYEKLKNQRKFSGIVSTTRPFGIRNYLFNEPERYSDSDLNENQFANSIKIFGVKGIKGGAKRVVGYISDRIITKNKDMVSKHKLFFTTSFSTNAVIPPEIIIANKNEICTETFLCIGPFDSENEKLNCKNFMETKFFRALLYFGKGTMHVTSSVFELIPLVNFNDSWDDEKLYNYFKLSQDDILLIESIF